MKKSNSWYKIVAADGGDGDHAEILIYDEIGLSFWGEGISAAAMVKDLSALDVKTIDVRINSVGGQVFDGLAIFNAIDRHPATVTTHIDGMAASIASIIALAGDEVRIAENAFMMIHNPWGVEIGDANAMRKMADTLDTLGGSLRDTYVAKSGQSEKVVTEWMDEETWFNAEEALAVGLVDEVAESMDIAASSNFERFRNVRDDVRERAATQRAYAAEGAGVDSGAELAAVEHGALNVANATVDPEPELKGPSPAELLQLSIETSRTLADTRR